MKAPCAKLMIFITPKTISSPDDTMNRIAAVVMISRMRLITVRCSVACGSPRASRRPANRLRLQVRTLFAGIDAGKALDHLDAAVILHLPQIHAERRMMLLRHRDSPANSVRT